MRLIDIDKLYAEAIMIDDYFYIREIDIECAPIVDAEPVCHGQWIKPTVIDGRAFNIPHCSVCNEVPCGVDEHTNYCPNCGAKMDEVSE